MILYNSEKKGGVQILLCINPDRCRREANSI